jgi:hypothetical protein
VYVVPVYLGLLSISPAADGGSGAFVLGVRAGDLNPRGNVRRISATANFPHEILAKFNNVRALS